MSLVGMFAAGRRLESPWASFDPVSGVGMLVTAVGATGRAFVLLSLRDLTALCKIHAAQTVASRLS